MRAEQIEATRRHKRRKNICDFWAFLWPVSMPLITRFILNPSHLKWCTFRNTDNDRRKPIVFFRGITDDFANRWHIVILDAAAKRIRHQFFRDCLSKLLRTLYERPAQIVRPGYIR